MFKNLVSVSDKNLCMQIFEITTSIVKVVVVAADDILAVISRNGCVDSPWPYKLQGLFRSLIADCCGNGHIHT